MDRRQPAYHCIFLANTPRATLRLRVTNDAAAIALGAELWASFPDCSRIEIRQAGRIVHSRWRDPAVATEDKIAS